MRRRRRGEENSGRSPKGVGAICRCRFGGLSTTGSIVTAKNACQRIHRQNPALPSLSGRPPGYSRSTDWGGNVRRKRICDLRILRLPPCFLPSAGWVAPAREYGSHVAPGPMSLCEPVSPLKQSPTKGPQRRGRMLGYGCVAFPLPGGRGACPHWKSRQTKRPPTRGRRNGSNLNLFQGVQKLIDGGDSFVHFGLEGSHDQASEFGIQVGSAFQDGRWWTRVVMQGSFSGDHFPLPGVLKSTKAIAGDSQGKDVDALVCCPATDNFRRHVQGSARAIARGHEGRSRRHRKAKVDQLQARHVGQADVVSRADVSVNEPLAVNVLKRLGHVSNQRHLHAGHQMMLLFDDDLLQARSFDVFHDDHRLTLGGHTGLKGFHHLGVFHLESDFTFARLVEAFEAGLE